ncbi:MAG: SseB family protein [Rhodocyclaceae bacterium]|jgi:hypothetical protein|nr:SseB family protein [Rhodocyclaceae bacterium]
MTPQPIEPKNELERKLFAAMNGELSGEDFMRELLVEQVFIPIRDDKDDGIAGFQRTTKATPLVVRDEDGQNILVLFTSPERAKDFLADTPDYSGGLLAEFEWIVERMEPGFAIVVNPGDEFGIDIAPDNVTEMLEMLAEKAAKN